MKENKLVNNQEEINMTQPGKLLARQAWPYHGSCK